MTDFDRAVLRWLDTASVTDRARSVTLGRTLVGIQSYAELIRGDDSTAAIPVDAIRLDIHLKDTVARAQRRVEDGHPLQLGELPPPPPGPQTLLSARSAATSGPNLRRMQQSGGPSAQRTDGPAPSAAAGGNNNAVPLSARSGVLASARGTRGEPARPAAVPPLKLSAQKKAATGGR